MIIYYLIFIYFVIIAVLRDKFTLNTQKQILLLSGILLIIFAGLRGERVDIDYKTYLSLFKNLPDISNLFVYHNFVFLGTLEPSFILIGSIIKHFFLNGFPLIIFIYALIGVSTKIKAIPAISAYPLLSVLIYFSSLYFLQDMNQIRTGGAIGFVFLSFPHILNRDFIRFLLLVLVATFFHYSAIVFIPFYFFNRKSINKLFYIFIITVPIILNLMNFNFIEILTSLNLGIYSEKIHSYILMQNWLKEDINIFNFSIIFQILMSAFFIYFCEKTDNPYAVLFTKIMCFGVAFFYIFTFSPILAFRLSELLSAVQIFLIPLFLKIIKPKALSEAIVIFISILYFINLMVVNNIFNSYHTIFN